MSEEKNIRINKILRELNISLERAVDYLKDKGVTIEASPNTKISQSEYSILCNEFAGDKGNKEASKEVSEEKRKEKEALRVEREKELELQKKHEEELLRQQQEVIKAKATVTGPKQVGKIDLDPKKQPSSEVEKVEEVKPIPVQEVVKIEEPVQEKPTAEEEKPIVSPEKVEQKPAAQKNQEPNLLSRQLLPLKVKQLKHLLQLLHLAMKNLRPNIKSYQEQQLPDKKLIYLKLINLKRKRKNQKFNLVRLRNKRVVLMIQIKIKEKEFNLNRERLEVRIQEIHKEVRLVRVKQLDQVSIKVLARQLLPKLSQPKKKYKNKSAKP